MVALMAMLRGLRQGALRIDGTSKNEVDKLIDESMPISMPVGQDFRDVASAAEGRRQTGWSDTARLAKRHHKELPDRSPSAKRSARGSGLLIGAKKAFRDARETTLSISHVAHRSTGI